MTPCTFQLSGTALTEHPCCQVAYFDIALHPKVGSYLEHDCERAQEVIVLVIGDF